MKGFVQDIEGLAVKNAEFRRVLYTAKHCQLVLMALKPKEEIGAEVHKLDQSVGCANRTRFAHALWSCSREPPGFARVQIPEYRALHSLLQDRSISPPQKAGCHASGFFSGSMSPGPL
jgi:hypothetical protein